MALPSNSVLIFPGAEPFSPLGRQSSQPPTWCFHLNQVLPSCQISVNAPPAWPSGKYQCRAAGLAQATKSIKNCEFGA